LIAHTWYFFSFSLSFVGWCKVWSQTLPRAICEYASVLVWGCFRILSNFFCPGPHSCFAKWRLPINDHASGCSLLNCSASLKSGTNVFQIQHYSVPWHNSAKAFSFWFIVFGWAWWIYKYCPFQIKNWAKTNLWISFFINLEIIWNFLFGNMNYNKIFQHRFDSLQFKNCWRYCHQIQRNSQWHEPSKTVVIWLAIHKLSYLPNYSSFMICLKKGQSVQLCLVQLEITGDMFNDT